MSEPEQPPHVPASAPDPEAAVPAPFPITAQVPARPMFAPPGDPAVALPPSGSSWARLSRSTVLVLGVGMGAAAVGACWLSLSLLGSDEVKANAGPSSSATADEGRAPEPFGTDGTLTVIKVGAGLETGELRSGTNGSSDIDFGTQVNITDAAGTLVATGSLDFGEKTEAGCTFAFTVDDITPGSKFYTVEASHRGGLTQTEADLRAGKLEFTLGD
ncbi:hypothetical protein OHA79_02760 [Streptomyces sp. NBC_00841]|uniref:hypothetical protein n=1 Tax=Streptomyces sp. NBC_00841 TaxID=2975847 RepID=UPI002DD84AF4|nr:hypothetical protein [Streptomyces sp. NBC_00841]WRZ96942.1 hypothetical protein OHA79_02760 [Streptomyces sp. NBC_00841]